MRRSGEFYNAVAQFPYRSDAGSPGLHDVYIHTPGWLIPEVVIRSLPAWMRADFGRAAIWQWVALAVLVTSASTLVTSDWATFLAIQEDVLLKVMNVVGASGCGFAFPSQTHYVTTDAGMDAEVRQRAEEQVLGLRASGGLTVAGFLEEPNQADEPAWPHRMRRPAA